MNKPCRERPIGPHSSYSRLWADADTVPIDVGARIEADPLALGLAMEVDREVVLMKRYSPTAPPPNTVAKIGRRERALQRGCGLAGDDGAGQAHPHRRRPCSMNEPRA